MLAILHIVRDPSLLQRVRREVHDVLDGEDCHIKATDAKDLAKSPLLSSIYAETLRLYVQTLFVFTTPQADLRFDKWLFPRGALGLLYTGICHMDDSFWNTQDGRHPITAFWAERFLIDPSDPLSGPIRPDLPERKDAARKQKNPCSSGKPWFSTEGLEGSWIPYGGKFRAYGDIYYGALTCHRWSRYMPRAIHG